MKKQIITIITVLCLTAMLAACGLLPGGQTAAPSGGTQSAAAAAAQEPTPTLPPQDESFTGVVTADSIGELENYPCLKTADLSGSSCYEEILAYAAAHPEVTVSYTVALPGLQEPVLNTAEALNITAEETATALLEAAPYLPAVKTLTLNGDNITVETLEALQETYPEAELSYSVTIAGSSYDRNTTELDLSALQPGAVEEAAAALAKLKALERVELMAADGTSRLSLGEVAALETGAKQASFHYCFTLFGQELTTEDERVEYTRAQIGDAGVELVREAMSAMNKLTYIKLDTCKVSDGEMARLRDDFPGVKVVWRVWFGPYNVLTDTTRILASIKGYCLTAQSCESLKYCTDVKYLDIGHNTIQDISFVQYMPDLEVAVVGINYWYDATPLASCKKLEYLEVFNTNLTDLSPLAELTNLKHLNICFLQRLTDITPLYGMTQLERLWIGCYNNVPQEQMDEIRLRLPNTEINTEVLAPIEGGWREGERYELLNEQLGYHAFEDTVGPEYSLGGDS